MKQYRLGFIGCGHMGMSIARGVLNNSLLKAEEIAVYDPSESIQETCRNLGFAVCGSEKELAENAHIVLLAVTPQIVDKVLPKLRDVQINCLLSIVAALSMKHIRDLAGDIPVIRVMPNTPLMVSCGAAAMCHTDDCDIDDLAFVTSLFEALGVVRSIPESQMNDIISVHGSTPAYFYYFLNSILKDTIRRGVDPETARTLLVQTMIGSGKLLEAEPDKPLEEFVDSVCSKGGTTIEAIRVFRHEDLDRMVKKANDECIRRAEELSK